MIGDKKIVKECGKMGASLKGKDNSAIPALTDQLVIFIIRSLLNGVFARLAHHPLFTNLF